MPVLGNFSPMASRALASALPARGLAPLASRRVTAPHAGNPARRDRHFETPQGSPVGTLADAPLLIKDFQLGCGMDDAPVVVVGTEHAYELLVKEPAGPSARQDRPLDLSLSDSPSG
jgi:hypothetical protein